MAVQIESKTAVDHAEEILAVDGVDGCWIGPIDLANSMGVDLSTPEGSKVHEAAILKVLDACQKTGKIPGIASTPGTAQRRLDQGFLFVTVGWDSGLLASKAVEILKEDPSALETLQRTWLVSWPIPWWPAIWPAILLTGSSARANTWIASLRESWTLLQSQSLCKRQRPPPWWMDSVALGRWWHAWP